MGIADDIRPRNSQHLHHQIDDYFTVPEKKEKADQAKHPQHESKETREELELFKHPAPNNLIQEDFFKPEENHNHNRSHSDPKQPSHWGRKILIIFIFIGAIGFAAYQSYKKSISLYNSDSTANNKEEEYKGEVITQDYTSTPSQSQTATTSQTATPTTTETTTPAPVAPVIDKSTIKLKVLNGNGVTGSAATVKSQLTRAGFTVASVTNAKSFSYKTTIIYYHTGKEAEATLVNENITGRETSLELSDTIAGSNDVVVVVGKK